jgi:tetratricopeptide (TPR) repeat protein
MTLFRLLPCLLVTTLCAAPALAEEPAPVPSPAGELLPVPTPDLASLEPSVASQLRAAGDLLEPLLKSPGTDPLQLAEVYGELGRLYHAYRIPTSAEPAYRNAARLAPQDFRWPYYLGALLQEAGRLDEAAESYARTLTLRPRELPALVHLGEVYLAQNRVAQASFLFHLALDSTPRAPAALAGLGQAALAEERFAEAARHLEDALAQMPGADRLHYPLALAYRGMGDLATAQQHLDRRGSVGIRPPDPLLEELADLTAGERAHLLRGRAAYQAGRHAEAAEEFRRALAAKPESVTALVNLGSALDRLGDRPGALEHYRRALERSPDNATARFNLGLLLDAEGEHAEALTHLQAAAHLAEEDPGVQLALAQALQRDGRPEEALGSFQMAFRLDPTSEEARLGGAQALSDLGRYEEAKRVLEAAVADLPASGTAAHALARLLAACPDASLRDGARALDLAQRVLAVRATVVHGETVAMALAESGRCSEAVDLQRRILDGARQVADPATLDRLETALSRYGAGEPCRPPFIAQNPPG